MATRILFLTIALAIVGFGCGSLQSRGTVPPPDQDGLVDPSDAPDFISVLDRTGAIAGYVRKELVLGAIDDDPWPVYANDLTTLVGHMYVGKGFVPLGADPEQVPDFPADAGASVAP